MRYFLKTVLDKDLRVLLKMKTFEYIDSSEDGKPDYELFKKKLKKNLLLDRYIDNLMKKNIGIQDQRLLTVLGFGDALKLVMEQKARQKQMEENGDVLKQFIDKSQKSTKKLDWEQRVLKRFQDNKSDLGSQQNYVKKNRINYGGSSASSDDHTQEEKKILFTDEVPAALGRQKKAVKFDSQVRADKSHSPYRLNPPAEIGKETNRSPQTFRRPTVHVRN